MGGVGGHAPPVSYLSQISVAIPIVIRMLRHGIRRSLVPLSGSEYLSFYGRPKLYVDVVMSTER